MLLLLAILAVGGGLAWVFSTPTSPAAESPSGIWLQRGPYAVQAFDHTFIDHSRPTAANNSYPGSNNRELKATIWYPEGFAGPHPLVIYSHGFMSTRTGGRYMAAGLASRGYVVVAADYPLTYRFAPGGPAVQDVIQQPGDVSFLIDATMQLSSDVRPFGAIDSDRIGAFGVSLGGLTATLAGYHPRWRDPRIAAVASVAGLSFMFTQAFFTNGQAPFLMVGSSLDAVVEYAANAADIPERVPGSVLVTIAGGSHVGYADMAEPFMRAVANPDALGCRAILAGAGVDADDPDPPNPFTVLGEPGDGVVFQEPLPGICALDPMPETIHAGRQHMIAEVAVTSFFESHFNLDAHQRQRAGQVLTRYLAEDFQEAAVRQSGR